jgi:hypothetical protein
MGKQQLLYTDMYSTISSYNSSMRCIPALALLPRTYHLMTTVKHLLSKVSNQSAPSEDVAL